MAWASPDLMDTSQLVGAFHFFPAPLGNAYPNLIFFWEVWNHQPVMFFMRSTAKNPFWGHLGLRCQGDEEEDCAAWWGASGWWVCASQSYSRFRLFFCFCLEIPLASMNFKESATFDVSYSFPKSTQKGWHLSASARFLERRRLKSLL